MNRMQEGVRLFKCGIHCAGGTGLAEYNFNECDGSLVTRRSILGAELRGCIKGWNQFDLSGWPEVVAVEEL